MLIDGARPVDAEERARAEATAGILGPFEVGLLEVQVPVEGEVALPTALYCPLGTGPGPAVVTRTPYGKAYWHDDGVFWASHGYYLALQDCRGTASYFSEAEDGGATVQWVRDQEWCDGRVAVHGMSYMGFTAWAAASTSLDALAALSVAYYSSDRISSWYPGGSFGLDLALQWSTLQAHNDRSGTTDDELLGVPPGIRAAYMHLPLVEADVVHAGHQVPFYRERVLHRGDDPHWAPLDLSAVAASPSCPPTLLFGGWWDYQRQYLWEDFVRLQRAGVQSRLLLGPWMHGGGKDRGNQEALAWFDHFVRGAGTSAPRPLTFFVTGAEKWRDLEAWTDLATAARRWYLADGGQLVAEPPARSDGPTRYTYDPADPTPSVGLASFDPDNALPCDNRALEQRSDVVVFSTDLLEDDLVLLGPVTAELWVTSTAASADFFVRLTDVDERGSSVNVLDRLARIEGDSELSADRPLRVVIDLGPRAHVFRRSHRLRVQISSGAFPFYARNLGTGEDLATGTRAQVADQAIWHDLARPSSVELSVEAAASTRRSDR